MNNEKTRIEKDDGEQKFVSLSGNRQEKKKRIVCGSSEIQKLMLTTFFISN